MAKFMVDGKEEELVMMVNGIDISPDFIGNTSHGMDIDDEGRYVASPEDYAWWRETIAAHQKMEALIAQYKEVYDPDLVDQVVSDWVDVDLSDQPGQVQIALRLNFGRIAIRQALNAITGTSQE